MKTREVKFDEIITKYRDIDFEHGEITYEQSYLNEHEEKILSSAINVRLAIKESDRESFVEDFTDLIQRYAQ